MDDRLSKALREAYTYNRDDIILQTIEIQHESFIAINQQPFALRVVHDNEDLSAKIESYHNIDPGQIVVYKKSAFDIKLPEKSNSIPEMKIIIDNVANDFWVVFENAIRYRSPITVYYREYLKSRAEICAEINPTTFDFQIQTISANLTKVEALGNILLYQNKRILNKKIEKTTFPGLG